MKGLTPARRLDGREQWRTCRRTAFSWMKIVGRTKSLFIALTCFLAVSFWPTMTASAQQLDYRIYVSDEYGATITIFDGLSEKQIATISVSGRAGEVRPRGMAVSPDGSTIYAAISDFQPQHETSADKIAAIDVSSDKIVQTYPAGVNPERVALSPDGTQLWASLEGSSEGAVFDTASAKQLATFQVGIEPEGVGVSPDGHWVYITSETSHTVAVIDARS